ncbi:hypothetical protein [Lacinutrix sp. MedPE-SW]|uniref:hypothetical protein n=1 Tax=Lacinutrix sp. MedPE-SW TaxID=1860087 RepID=UPI00091ADB0E|nr:hypothetical protein [Lacinutrix sp. MedPE-SW]OIQ20323.1 MAG: hypothetical protein BM549_10400 [Lacinutrix sp. MedPE-SW]
MQRVLVLLLIICATSCEYFNAKKIASEDILKEELKTFNWSDVDTYPTFVSCDTLNTKDTKKNCFINTLSQHITSSLQEETIIVSKDINDTVILAFQISETGQLNIKDISINDSILVQIPELENMLFKSLNTLPKIYPAIKRNQPVKTEFKLPIIIEAN